MKRTLIILVLAAISLSACRNDEKACPGDKELALQIREDSLDKKEQMLIMREKMLAEREQAGGTVTMQTGTENAGQPVRTASESTVNTYKASVKGNPPQQQAAPRVAYKKSRSAFPGQYPEGSERLLTEKDMQYQTAWGKKVMLNEIYARKGMIFKDEALARHFRNESWYKGKKAAVPAKTLSSVEKQNIAFIQAHQ